MAISGSVSATRRPRLVSVRAPAPAFLMKAPGLAKAILARDDVVYVTRFLSAMLGFVVVLGVTAYLM
jgi:hypothetical protein